MQQVPDITTSHSDVVVDEIRYVAPVFGVLGEERWEIRWRSVTDPGLRGGTLLTADTTSGSAAVGDLAFTFVVRWREDLRRARGKRVEKDVVTPNAVLQLAEIRSRR